MKAFDLVRIGEEAGGALGGTAPYRVDFHKECTVKEFIEYVLTREEWGYIGIYSTELDGKFFGKPKCEYTCNCLKTNLPGEYLDKKIKDAKADGGYSRMDYILYLFEEGETT